MKTRACKLCGVPVIELQVSATELKICDPHARRGDDETTILVSKDGHTAKEFEKASDQVYGYQLHVDTCAEYDNWLAAQRDEVLKEKARAAQEDMFEYATEHDGERQSATPRLHGTAQLASFLDPHGQADLIPIRKPVSTVKYTRGMDADTKFELFHSANPHVMECLVHMSKSLKAQGVDRWGIANLFECMRFAAVVRTDSDDGFKLNNNLKASYARRIMEEHPILTGFFELREHA